MYAISLSGVSSQEGTASQVSQQIKLQSTATVNKMSRDYDEYVRNLRASDDADALNTAFSVASDVFGTAGRLAYDNVRVNESANADVQYEPFSYKISPTNINQPESYNNTVASGGTNWVTPQGFSRLGSLTAPVSPTSFNKGT